jgi:hypothetical protein
MLHDAPCDYEINRLTAKWQVLEIPTNHAAFRSAREDHRVDPDGLPDGVPLGHGGDFDASTASRVEHNGIRAQAPSDFCLKDPIRVIAPRIKLPAQALCH